MSTPIFDQLEREQGVTMPLPPIKTHDEFMDEHGHDVWLERAEMILAGTLPEAKVTPIKRPAAKKTATKKPAPKK